jgi:uncharacterized protein YigE (DUF2233 family)
MTMVVYYQYYLFATIVASFLSSGSVPTSSIGTSMPMSTPTHRMNSPNLRPRPILAIPAPSIFLADQDRSSDHLGDSSCGVVPAVIVILSMQGPLIPQSELTCKVQVNDDPFKIFLAWMVDTIERLGVAVRAELMANASSLPTRIRLVAPEIMRIVSKQFRVIGSIKADATKFGEVLRVHASSFLDRIRIHAATIDVARSRVMLDFRDQLAEQCRAIGSIKADATKFGEVLRVHASSFLDRIRIHAATIDVARSTVMLHFRDQLAEQCRAIGSIKADATKFGEVLRVHASSFLDRIRIHAATIDVARSKVMLDFRDQLAEQWRLIGSIKADASNLNSSAKKFMIVVEGFLRVHASSFLDRIRIHAATIDVARSKVMLYFRDQLAEQWRLIGSIKADATKFGEVLRVHASSFLDRIRIHGATIDVARSKVMLYFRDQLAEQWRLIESICNAYVSSCKTDVTGILLVLLLIAFILVWVYQAAATTIPVPFPEELPPPALDADQYDVLAEVPLAATTKIAVVPRPTRSHTPSVRRSKRLAEQQRRVAPVVRRSKRLQLQGLDQYDVLVEVPLAATTKIAVVPRPTRSHTPSVGRSKRLAEQQRRVAPVVRRSKRLQLQGLDSHHG